MYDPPSLLLRKDATRAQLDTGILPPTPKFLSYSGSSFLLLDGFRGTHATSPSLPHTISSLPYPCSLLLTNYQLVRVAQGETEGEHFVAAAAVNWTEPLLPTDDIRAFWRMSVPDIVST